MAPSGERRRVSYTVSDSSQTYVERGGPRNSDSLLRWSPDPTGGIWNATKETKLPG